MFSRPGLKGALQAKTTWDVHGLLVLGLTSFWCTAIAGLGSRDGTALSGKARGDAGVYAAAPVFSTRRTRRASLALVTRVNSVRQARAVAEGSWRHLALSELDRHDERARSAAMKSLLMPRRWCVRCYHLKALQAVLEWSPGDPSTSQCTIRGGLALAALSERAGSQKMGLPDRPVRASSDAIYVRKWTAQTGVGSPCGRRRTSHVSVAIPQRTGRSPGKIPAGLQGALPLRCLLTPLQAERASTRAATAGTYPAVGYIPRVFQRIGAERRNSAEMAGEGYTGRGGFPIH